MGINQHQIYTPSNTNHDLSIIQLQDGKYNYEIYPIIQLWPKCDLHKMTEIEKGDFHKMAIPYCSIYLHCSAV